MQLDHPTTEIFFVYALSFCRVKIYKSDERFIRKLLKAADIEVFEHKNEDCLQVDTRLWTAIISEAIPELMGEVMKKETEGWVYGE